MSNTNFHFLSKASAVEKIFETNNDKLIALMMFTKGNVDCRRAKDAFERISSNTNNNSAVFCVVDVDHLDGTNRYVNNSTSMPRFDLYLNGQLIGQRSIQNDREIDELIKYGLQQLATRSMSNGISGLNNNSAQQIQQIQQIQQMPPQVTQQQMQQIRQTIMNNAAQNPALYNQYSQNPNLLNIHAMQYAQQLQQQLNAQYQAQQAQVQAQQSQQSMIAPLNNLNMMNATGSIAQPASLMAPLQSSLQSSPQFKYNLQELADIFEIFKNMVKLGLINIDSIPNVPPETQSIVQEEIILPNGDKIIKIDDDKYVIEKNTS